MPKLLVLGNEFGLFTPALSSALAIEVCLECYLMPQLALLYLVSIKLCLSFQNPLVVILWQGFSD